MKHGAKIQERCSSHLSTVGINLGMLATRVPNTVRCGKADRNRESIAMVKIVVVLSMGSIPPEDNCGIDPVEQQRGNLYLLNRAPLRRGKLGGGSHRFISDASSTNHAGVCEINTHLDVAGVFNVPTPLPIFQSWRKDAQRQLTQMSGYFTDRLHSPCACL